MSQTKNLLLLSGSKAAGNLPEGEAPGFLDWAEPWVIDLFSEAKAQNKPVLFVPYARPGGESEQSYFELVSKRFSQMGLDTVCAPEEGLSEAFFEKSGGVFIGGGHTPTLLYKLQSTNSLELIKHYVHSGMPYMGSSAGSLITCPTIKTNNDMPGPSNDVMDLKSMGLINFQLNCHYMDNTMHDPKHQGETRDLRLKEFCTFNPDTPVLGLYEGQALRVRGDKMELWTSPHARGTHAPVFLNDTRSEIVCELRVPKAFSL